MLQGDTSSPLTPSCMQSYTAMLRVRIDAHTHKAFEKRRKKDRA